MKSPRNRVDWAETKAKADNTLEPRRQSDTAVNEVRTTHTPGPWAVNPFAAQVEAFSERGGETVCQLVWPTEMRSEAETEANARLIAAAPDLLASLKDCVGRFTEAFPAAEAYEPIQKARAAIASAEYSS